MPQLQNLVLTDRATTPVNHTFVPRDVRDNVGSVEETTGVPVGNPRARISVRQNGNGKYKGLFALTVPIVQTQIINSVSTPVVVRTAYAELNVTFDETSSEQERKDVIGMMMSGLDPAKTLVNDALVKLQGVY